MPPKKKPAKGRKKRSSPKRTPKLKAVKRHSENAVPPTAPKETKIDVEYLCPPTKSRADVNDYRLIRLPNGILALLISDNGGNCNHRCHHREPNPKRSSKVRHVEVVREKVDGVDPMLRKAFNYEPERNLFINSFKTSKIPKKFKKPNKTLKDYLTLASEPTPDGTNNESQKSALSETAFAISVNVGSAKDPSTHQGLAHFCEHMLFMGSKGFPSEEAFTSLVSNKGAEYNAFTQSMSTTYYFSLNCNSLDKGVEMLSQMISNPLFNLECVGREVEAVDNEFMLNEHSDFWAYILIISSTTKKNHPLSDFMCGNLETLRHPSEPKGLESLQKVLVDFHKEFYVGSAMTLAVQSGDSLDELEKMIVEYFSGIQAGKQNIRRNTTVPECLLNPFDTTDFKKMYVVKGKNSLSHLILTWALPPAAWKNYKSKAIDFIAKLVSDEWENGLGHTLREKGWIIEMQSRSPSFEFYKNEYTTLWTIMFVLTEIGLNFIPDIIETVYSYFYRIREISCVEKDRYWNELAKSSTTEFEYSGPGKPVDLTVRAAQLLQTTPGEDIFVADSGIGCKVCAYSNEVVNRYLQLLVPKMMNITILYPGAELVKYQVERYTKTRYVSCVIKPDWIQRFEKARPLYAFNIPVVNPFLTEFGTVRLVRCTNPIKPFVVEKTPKFTLIHDGHIGKPVYKAKCTVRLFSSQVKWSRINQLKLEILGACLNQMMLPAKNAINRSGIDFEIEQSNDVLILEFWGFFSVTFPMILEAALHPIGGKTRQRIPQPMFESLKSHIMGIHKDATDEGEYVLRDLFEELTILERPSSYKDLKLLEELSYGSFINFVERLRHSTHAIINCLGNISVYDSNCIASVIKNLDFFPNLGNWKESPSLISTITNNLPPGRCIRSKNDYGSNKNSFVMNCYQTFPDSGFDVVSIVAFLAKYMKAPSFQILRTEQQLGYAVVLDYCSYFLETPLIFVAAVFPAAKRTLCHVDMAFDNFFYTFYNRYLKKLSPSEFRELKCLWDLPPPLTQEEIFLWYENTFLKHMCLDLADQKKVRWLSNAGKLSKLSIQILGSAEEKCKSIAQCNNSAWTKPDPSGPMTFAVDVRGPGSLPYFLHDIQNFKNKNKR